MSVDRGISAFERFGAHLADVDRRCPSCGHAGGAEWAVVAAAGDLAYRRRCTACEAEWTGRVRLDRARRR
jgi:hypothetical protein